MERALGPHTRVYVVNDGDLLGAFVRETLCDFGEEPRKGDVVLRLATGLASTILELDVLSEVGWMAVSMADDEEDVA